MRASNTDGASPAPVAEHDVRLFPLLARHRAARLRVESGDVLPYDMLADPAATHAAIAARFPELLG